MANPQLNNEKGYALLVVLLVISLISILGIGLMGLTVNSMNFVNANKDFIEEKSKAEMEVASTMEKIEKEVEELNDYLESDIANLDFVINQLNSILTEIESEGVEGSSLERTMMRDGSDGVYLERFDLIIPIDNGSRKLVKTFTFSTIADVFRYSAVTPGDMYLNGAPYIQGDIFVGNDLFVRDKAHYSRYGEKWEPTSWPAVNGDLTVKNTLNFYSGNSAEQFLPNQDNLDNYFSIAPRIGDSDPDINRIEVETLIDNQRKKLEDVYSYPYKWDEHYYNNNTSHSSQHFRSLRISNGAQVQIKGDLIIDRYLAIEQGSRLKVNGSIHVKGHIGYWNFWYDPANLRGELEIPKNESIFINGTTSINNLDLKGQMYIDGRVSINNELNTNGTIYVSDGGEIENLSNNEDGGTLVVISEDKLQVSNNNLYNPEPKVMDAFLYTNSELEMFGVGSNIQINGGLYGNPIILNSVKGNTQEGYRDLIFQPNQNSISPEQARLSVYYEDELILNPPEGIPTVEKVTLKELDSQFIK